MDTCRLLARFAAAIESQGIAAVPAELFVELADVARRVGASPVVLSVLVDPTEPAVARERAFAKLSIAIIGRTDGWISTPDVDARCSALERRPTRSAPVVAAHAIAGAVRSAPVSDERDARRAYFERACVELHERFGSLNDGQLASYIPELAEVDPDQFAIATMTVHGERIGIGDVDQEFTIQSISKLLLYGLALETHGRDEVLHRVGVAPTGDAFNAIELDEATNRAPNPMVNAGAIAITDMVEGDTVEERVAQMQALYERYLGRTPTIDHDVWNSERQTGNRNRAIAYLMLSRGIIGERVEETLP
jgi:hypothetical protein